MAHVEEGLGADGAGSLSADAGRDIVQFADAKCFQKHVFTGTMKVRELDGPLRLHLVQMGAGEAFPKFHVEPLMKNLIPSPGVHTR